MGLLFFSKSIYAFPTIVFEGAMQTETFGTGLVIDHESYTEKNRSMKRWLAATQVWSDAVDGFVGTATLNIKFPAARYDDGSFD